MNEFASIRNQRCPNLFCQFHGQVLAGNVIVHSQTARRMRCKCCRKTWVSHRNQMHYGLKTDLQKVQAAIQMIRQGTSIRKTAFLIRASTGSIQRWKARAKNQFIS